jgi:predicted regulator of Ras-like GTPase activity (Roadblock/LC7/MglB family)
MPVRAVESRPEPTPRSEPPLAAPDTRLNGLLWTIARDIEGIRGLVIADSQGLPVASLARGRATAAAAAMATLLGSAATKVATELGASEPTDIVIETRELVVLMHFLGSGCVLLAAFGHDINLGFARLELDRFSADLKTSIDALR